jgi:hypothetical protein
MEVIENNWLPPRDSNPDMLIPVNCPARSESTDKILVDYGACGGLKRDPKSVRRDVLKLEQAGVVRTREQINPSHGRVRIVEPVAREYRLTAVL